MKKTIAISLALASCLNVYANPDTPKAAWTTSTLTDVDTIKDAVDVRLAIRTMYDVARKDKDIQMSQISFGIGAEHMRSILKDIGLDQEKYPEDVMVSFSLKVSALPSLMRDSTEEELNLKLEETLASKRAEMELLVQQKVDAALKADPKAQLISPNMLQQIRLKMIAGGMTTVDQQLQAVRAAKAENFSVRLDQIQRELTYQEIAIGLGKVIQGGSALVFAKVGKFRYDNGPSVNSEGLSDLEALRLANSRTQRNTGTSATGGLNVGYKKEIGSAAHIKVETYFFHDRMPFISGAEYMKGIVSVDDEKYDRLSQWTKIDSKLLKVIIENPDTSAYATIGSYDGDMAHGAGISHKLNETMTTYVDYSGGRNLGAEKAISVFQTWRFLPEHTAYLGVEKVKGSYQPTMSSRPDGKVDTTEYVIGLNSELWSRNYKYVSLKWDAGVELVKIKDDGNSLRQSVQKTQKKIGTQIKGNF